MHLASFAYRISTAGPRPPHGEENSAGARHSTEQPAGPLLTPLSGVYSRLQFSPRPTDPLQTAIPLHCHCHTLKR